MSYAVRGPLAIRAVELEKEIKAVRALLGMPPFQKSAVFLNIVQKAFDPPPLLFEHLSYFAGGVF